MKIHVKFKDSAEEEIVAVFGCPQDPDQYAFLGDVENDDPRLGAFNLLVNGICVIAQS